jgi:hypothetical protein
METFIKLLDKALSADPLTLALCSILVLSTGFVLFILKTSK